MSSVLNIFIVYIVTEIIVHQEISDYFKYKIKDNRFFSYLFNCFFCTSVWISGFTQITEHIMSENNFSLSNIWFDMKFICFYIFIVNIINKMCIYLDEKIENI